MNKEKVYLSLGSNMGDSRRNLLEALAGLDRRGLKIRKVSGIYQTEPVGNVPQDDYLNLVAVAETCAGPKEVLEICQQVEKDLGRVRLIRWGPRTIDVDILFFGNRKVREEDLIIPHPRLQERAFVLIPLGEVDPQLLADLGATVPAGQKVILHTKALDVKIILETEGLTLED